MLPLEHPNRIEVAFDDHRLVANAGLSLPVTLAHHLELGELMDRHIDLGRAPDRANVGDKMLTLVASALAGGDCIDDADALRTGGTDRVPGCVIKAASTLGTFLRSFRWGHVRQLDRVSRELLAQAWAAGAGPGDDLLTIDLDSTVCETFGLAKEGAQRHNYAGVRGYHPILAVAAGTGDVLMSQLRKGRANTAWAGTHFLRETVKRVPMPEPPGHSRCGPTAASTPTPWSPSAARWTYASPSPSASTRACATSSKPYPRRNGRPYPCILTLAMEPSAADRHTLDLEADHRRHAEIENAIRDPASSAGQALKYGVGLNHLPTGRFPANGAWLAVQVMAHNLARWTGRIGLGEAWVTTKTLRRRFFSLAGRITRKARRLTLHLPQGWPWQNQFGRALCKGRDCWCCRRRYGWQPGGHRCRCCRGRRGWRECRGRTRCWLSGPRRFRHWRRFDPWCGSG